MPNPAKLLPDIKRNHLHIKCAGEALNFCIFLKLYAAYNKAFTSP